MLGMTRAILARAALLALLAAAPALATTAGTDPWSTAVANLRTLFTGPIVTGLSVVCIIIGGLTLAFGEGGGKGRLAGMIFGLGMALGAVPFLNWITPAAVVVGAATVESAAAEPSPAQEALAAAGLEGGAP